MPHRRKSVKREFVLRTQPDQVRDFPLRKHSNPCATKLSRRPFYVPTFRRLFNKW